MSKKKKRSSSQKKNEITKGIFTVLEKEPKQSFNYKEIAAKLHIEDANDRNDLIKRLVQLKEKKRILEESRGKYKAIPATKSYHTGTVDITGRGNAYIIIDGLDDDVFIPFNKINKAFHKDTVEVYIYPRRKGKKLEGEITKVVSRNKTSFVGIVDMQKTFAFVRISDFRMYTDFFIPKDKIGDAADGDKVIVEFNEWPDKTDSPFGTITNVLGKPGEHNTEIHSILAEYGLPYEFPVEVEQFANQLDTAIKPEEIAKRRDMRNTLTFTIDPKDAKDFDDALSFEILENGNYEIGVHIADVSHYLTPDTVMDDEAYERATSVYLVDRVVPMLPEILSNNACSLRPHEEKYTFSAIFEIDKKAHLINQWFGRTVIDSNERFAYEEAQYIIENKVNSVPEDVSIRGAAYTVSNEVVEATLKLDELAKIMRTRRMNAGAISFDKVEVRFNLTAEGEPESVYFKEAKDANKLIEEFMLLANKKVAEFIGKQKPKKTFVYRIHDEPNEEKLMALNGIVSRFGHKLDFKDKKSISASLNQLLEDVKGKGEQNMVDTLAIRSMSKAIYTTDNIGHYGLAFDYYTHFTSPIRRYPDVMVHRLLQHYLDGGSSVKEEVYEEKCKHSSDMESLAANAERDSIKYMQIKFMQDHQDREFVGVISGVTEWGIYVEIIENKCEGMVRISDIKGDYYNFDEKQYAIIGERTKKVYQLGDEVVVMVKNTDLVKRHLDFTLIGKVE
ncbi:ribonuclease R [Cellulophaga tyrosinoxydans]|uniref:Ribonuclease R n=1 Tax=Cellulophaga tyrosinoxydans TaxID=504486 RepID=A0A1W1YTH3_9FLAO|nr:ribonuclease R [Cellulophaga tyrosinoxydans]SMC39413.1 exosome complex exonuclease DIS3/RRP44 [Cellulophaga tyrosinoxydans]